VHFKVKEDIDRFGTEPILYKSPHNRLLANYVKKTYARTQFFTCKLVPLNTYTALRSLSWSGCGEDLNNAN